MEKNILFLCGTLLMIGCAQGTSSNGILVEQNKSAEEAYTGGDAGGDTEIEEFWYLCCNTTSWDLNADSRLKDTSNPNVKSVTFNVTYVWMVTVSDSCAITRTEAENQWESGLEFYSVTPTQMVVPSTANTFQSFAQFNVKYPALGTYEARLDIEVGTLTINALDQIPTCTDNIRNGDETDVDCGGPLCNGCKENKNCRIDNDCRSNACIDEKCVDLPSDCDVYNAIDLGTDGKDVTVPSDGCVKVESDYPSWWGTNRTMNLIASTDEDYPIAFTWKNCEGIGDVEEFTHNWQSIYLEQISAECPTVIDLQGSGAEDITLVYFGA